MTPELTVGPETLEVYETQHSYSCSIRVPGAWLCEISANERTACQQCRGLHILPIPGNGRAAFTGQFQKSFPLGLNGIPVFVWYVGAHIQQAKS